MSLVLAFATRTVDQRVVSPLLCGSHPYPYGSLTYRFRLFVYQYKPLKYKSQRFILIFLNNN